MNKYLLIILLAFQLLPPASGGTVDIGGGFADHGVCAPVSIARGVTAALDAAGGDVLIAQMMDLRGSYGILRLNFTDGQCDFAPVSFSPSNLRGVFAAMYSSRNRFYSHHSDHFTEYDPAAGRYSFIGQTHPGMGMSMTEDDRGVIWTVTFPDCGVVSFDPATRTMTDYGSVVKDNFLQYARAVAADDRNFIYFGYGNARAQIVIFNPETREAVTVIPENERPEPAAALVFRAANGKVYGMIAPAAHYSDPVELWEKSSGRNNVYYELYNGKFTRLASRPKVEIKRIHSGTQDFRNLNFPSGREITGLDISGRTLKSISPDSGQEREYKLEYPSNGAHLMGLIATPDGKITGGTAFPMSNFVYDPATASMRHRQGAVQWNTMARTGNHIFIGAYNGGYLLDWDWTKPYAMPEKAEEATGNPRLVAPKTTPHIGRPHALAITPAGRRVLMGGTPGYGHTGGGLAIYDRENDCLEVIPHTDLIPDQAVHTLLITPDNRVFGGCTINAGTGGVVKATNAVFFEFDLNSRKVVWQQELFPKIRTYLDLAVSPDGAIIGAADGNKLFRFNPATRQLEKSADTGRFGSFSYQQGARVMLRRDQEMYVLCKQHILKLDPVTLALTEVAQSPVTIENSGAIIGDRLYFGSHGKLYSYRLP